MSKARALVVLVVAAPVGIVLIGIGWCGAKLELSNDLADRWIAFWDRWARGQGPA